MEKIRELKYYNLLKNVFIFLVFAFIAGIVSIFKGMDRAFDVRNYHIYNPYAFLHNRYSQDIMPADIQSYFNPIIDIPHYFLVRVLNDHPFVVTFLEGLGYAFLLFMIYKISEFVFKDFHKNWMAVICTAIGATAAVTRYGIGSLSNDLFIAGLVLISLYLLFKVIDKYNEKLVMASGIILGIACGLKLTTLLIAFGIFVSVCILCKSFEKPSMTIKLFLEGLIGGFLLSGAWWLVKLYIEYGNPVLPYFNSIFHSDMIESGKVFDADFSHLNYIHGIKMYLFLPFYFYNHIPMVGFEGPYQDFRFAAVYLSFVFALVTFAFGSSNQKIREKYGINYRYIEILLLSALIIYPIWINVFKTVRYLTIYSALSGVIVFASLIKLFEFLPDNWKSSIPVSVNNFKFQLNTYKSVIVFFILAISSFLIFTTNEPFMLRRIPVDMKVLDIQNMNLPDNSIVFMASSTGIMVPYQNPKARYIYVNAERLLKLGVHILSDKKIKEIQKLSKNNKDNIYIFIDYRFNHPFEIRKEIEYMTNSKFTYEDCRHVRANLGNDKVESAYHVCKLNCKFND